MKGFLIFMAVTVASEVVGAVIREGGLKCYRLF